MITMIAEAPTYPRTDQCRAVTENPRAVTAAGSGSVVPRRIIEGGGEVIRRGRGKKCHAALDSKAFLIRTREPARPSMTGDRSHAIVPASSSQ